MKLPIVITALITLPMTVAGMDVAPYQPGQKVDAEQAKELERRFAERPSHPWHEPAVPGSIAKHPDAELIRYGIEVLQHTAKTIGPDVADPAKRLSGNNLNCSNCHLKGTSGLPGTKKFGIPLVNVMNDYPQFRARSMTVGTIEERVNGCMTRSTGDGTPLPSDSREMRGMVAYFKWLAEGTNENDAMEGTSLPKIDIPARRADLVPVKFYLVDGLGAKSLHNPKILSCPCQVLNPSLVHPDIQPVLPQSVWRSLSGGSLPMKTSIAFVTMSFQHWPGVN